MNSETSQYLKFVVIHLLIGLAIFFVPLFFVVVRNLFKGRAKPPPGAPVDTAGTPQEPRAGDSEERNQHA